MPASGRIPFEGVLNCWNDEHDLPDLLLAISRSGKTGSLSFSNPEGDKTVFIKDGRIIFAESSSEDDGLGQYLLLTGRVSLVDYTRVSKLVRPAKRLGALLVERGILEPKDLVPAVKGQVRAILLGLFRRTETWYRFNEKSPRKESITLDLPVDQLVLEGVRYVESWRRVSKGVGDLDSVYRANPDLRARWSQLRLPESVRELLTMLQTERSLAQICTDATLADFDACRYLWAFRCLEWIQLADLDSTDAKTKTETASEPAPPTLVSRPVRRELEEAPAPESGSERKRVVAEAPPTLVSKRVDVSRARAKQSDPEPAAIANDLAHTQMYVKADPQEEAGEESTGEMMEAILDERTPDPDPVQPPSRGRTSPPPESASTQLFTAASPLPERPSHPTTAKTTPSVRPPASASTAEPASTRFFGDRSALHDSSSSAEEAYDDFLSMEDSAAGFEALVSEPAPAAAAPTPAPEPEPHDTIVDVDEVDASFALVSEALATDDGASAPSPPPTRPSSRADESEPGGLEAFVSDESDPFSSDIFSIDDIVHSPPPQAPAKKTPGTSPPDANKTQLDVGTSGKKA